VIDKTGLTGLYDITLEFAPEPGSFGMRMAGPAEGGPAPSAPDPTAPTVATAVQDQLGLKLEPARTMMEILVIDRAEKVPVEN
jgi:uncharacterized protein (TIGR03435 family)